MGTQTQVIFFLSPRSPPARVTLPSGVLHICPSRHRQVRGCDSRENGLLLRSSFGRARREKCRRYASKPLTARACRNSCCAPIAPQNRSLRVSDSCRPADVGGKTYFKVNPGHGVFVRESRLTIVQKTSGGSSRRASQSGADQPRLLPRKKTNPQGKDSEVQLQASTAGVDITDRENSRRASMASATAMKDLPITVSADQGDSVTGAADEAKVRRRGSTALLDTPKNIEPLDATFENALRVANMLDKALTLSLGGVVDLATAASTTIKEFAAMRISQSEAKVIITAAKREILRPSIIDKVAMIYAEEAGEDSIGLMNNDEMALAFDADGLRDIVGNDLSILDMTGEGKDLTPDEIFDIVDTNHDGEVTIKEFLRCFVPDQVKANRRRLSVEINDAAASAAEAAAAENAAVREEYAGFADTGAEDSDELEEEEFGGFDNGEVQKQTKKGCKQRGKEQEEPKISEHKEAQKERNSEDRRSEFGGFHEEDTKKQAEEEAQKRAEEERKQMEKEQKEREKRERKEAQKAERARKKKADQDRKAAREEVKQAERERKEQERAAAREEAEKAERERKEQENAAKREEAEKAEREKLEVKRKQDQEGEEEFSGFDDSRTSTTVAATSTVAKDLPPGSTPVCSGPEWKPLGPDDENVDFDNENSEYWYDGLFEDNLPHLPTDKDELEEKRKQYAADKKAAKKSKKKGKDDAGEGDAGDDGDGEDDKDDDDDDDDEDDDDEDGGAAGPQYILYPPPPPRNDDAILDALASEGSLPKGTANNLSKALASLIKLRTRWVKMQDKRNDKAGMKTWIQIVDTTNALMDDIAAAPNVDVRDKKGNTLLAHCFQKNFHVLRDVRQALVKVGANVNLHNSAGDTPLHHACRLQNEFLVGTLLAAGANPNIANKKGELPITVCFALKKKKDPGTIRCATLIAHSGKANLDLGKPAPSEKKLPDSAPLIQLINKKQPIAAEPFVHLLTFHGADVNVREPSKDPIKKPGKSALKIALANHPKQFSYTVDCIARDNTFAGSAPLDPAVFNEFEKPKQKGCPPLYLCCLFKQSAAVGNLLKLNAAGSDPTVKYQPPKMKGMFIPLCNSFEAACLGGAGGAVYEFMKRDESTYLPVLTSTPAGWDKKWKGIENIPLLITCVIKCAHSEAIYLGQMAIQFSMDLNVPYADVENMNLFLLFTALGHSAACKEILAANEDGRLTLDVTQTDIHNRNIAFYASYACADNRMSVLRRVLELGADPLVVDRFGVTALIAAARNGDERTVAILINKPYSFQNLTTANKEYVKPSKKMLAKQKKESKKEKSSFVANTPLTNFSRNPNGMMKQSQDNLLYIPYPPYKPGNWAGVSGTELNRTDEFGYTALWYGVLNKNADIVRMLIADPEIDVNPQNGSKFGEASGDTMTPLMLATCIVPRGKLDIFFMLLNHPNIDLTKQNCRGHTVRDIAFMEEIEFALQPMTDALQAAKNCPGLSKETKKISHFESPDVEWFRIEEKDGKKKEVEGKDVPKWKKAISAVPVYANGVWLRSVVNYDWKGKKEIKSEKWRQRKELAKIGAFKAAYAAAAVLKMTVSPDAGRAAEALTKRGEQYWWITKGLNIQGYDCEWMMAQMSGVSLPDKTMYDFVARHHCPEDVKCKRYSVGRFMTASTPSFYGKFWKEKFSDPEHAEIKFPFKERWVLKP